MDNIGLLLGMPLLIVLLGTFVTATKPLTTIAAIASWVQLALCVFILWPVIGSANESITLGNALLIDRTAAWFLVLTTVVVSGALTHAHLFFGREGTAEEPLEPLHVRQFYVLTALFYIAMMAVYASNNLGYLWISIEGTTLTTAGLVYYSRTKHALEATWKYFIICSVGIAFALLGTVLIFASSQYADVHGSLTITDLMKLAPDMNVKLLKFGFIFCFLGYGTKAGIFPLHSWLPDAHSEAPAPASAMLSGALLNCALFGIFRVSQIAQASNHIALSSNLSVWAGAVTVVAASLFLVRQHALKRLWAYSSVENVGLMLVAIGMGSPLLFFLQAANHSLAKVSLFLLSGNIIQATHTKSLKDMHGLMSIAPIWGVLLALAAFAVTGVPPFGAFISEWMILARNVQMHFAVPAGLVIAGLSLTFVAVCYHVARILVGTPRHESAAFQPLATSMVPALLLCCCLLLGLTVHPDIMWGAP